MYICQDCGRVFYELDRHKKDYGWDTEYGRNSAWQIEYTCPYCGSADFEEGEDCKICGRTFSTDDLYITDGLTYVCPDCYEEMEEDEE